MNQYCVSCGRDEWIPWARVGYRLWISRCRSCGLQRYIPKDSQSIKPDEFGNIDLVRYRASLEDLRKRSFRHVLEEAEALTTGRSLLDIGCSYGWLLDIARERGWNAVGVEPSPSAASEARSHGNIVFEGHFPLPEIKGRRFALITLMDVFEHISEPASFLSALSEVLEPNGLVAIKLPNSDGPIYRAACWLSRLTGGIISAPLGRMYQTRFPYPHLFYYDKKTLTNTLARAGFNIQRVYEENILGHKGLSDRILYSARTGLDNIFFRLQALGLHALLCGLIFFESKDILTVLVRRD
jgi:SAM-dependent methyltransferase